MVKYGTLEKIKKYFPNPDTFTNSQSENLPELKKEAPEDRIAKRLHDIPYREGERIELVKDGKTFLTETHFIYSKRSNKTQKKCPKCGQPGREFKDFKLVDKKGYYDVYYQHKIGHIKFVDVNTRKTIKNQYVRTKCKVGKGYTVEMMFNSMREEKNQGIS